MTRIQLWSYNYDPEPTGIGPVSRVWAQAMRDRGHEIQVVAAHPHYPEPRWGKRLWPYRETRHGIPILRLPLWIGRASARERYRQELSFTVAQAAALPALRHADVIVSVSPSFPALLPAMLNARLRKTPWVIWLQDILPDGATATGLLDGGIALRAARALELSAYRTAAKIVVPSKAFGKNLMAKGVPESKIEVVYNPATRTPKITRERDDAPGDLRILSMGNIGHSQGLAGIVRTFEGDPTIDSATLVLAGTGVAAGAVQAEIRSERVQMLGLVDDFRLEQELASASVGLVSQRHEGEEFNIPSKIMNFMTYGIPILAVVNPESETARIIDDSQAGWTVDSAIPLLLTETLQNIAKSPQSRAERAASACEYARVNFSPTKIVERFDAIIWDAQEARGH